ncbi:regulator of microtubule dynamics 2 [Pelobates cultripes]|uniref:Regulator of microtubule dynamics protein 2 n=1 Tax=Pelobates cultripes TaxID=61616 RepID=A0AAD1RG23_PELCU|nr:regulator of microtubule dynamics 2 [Pelobates cultripes]
MSLSESKGLILGLLAGAAGISVALLWLKKHGKSHYFQHIPGLWSTSNGHGFVQDHQGKVVVLQGSQLQILEKFGELLKSVEELKRDVKFLKETIPKLEEQIRDEIRGKNDGRRVSPQHKGLKRKKSETAKEPVEYPSSEEAESEGGYLTAHDTESEDEKRADGSKTKKEADKIRYVLKEADKKHSGSESEKQEGFRMLLNNKEKFENHVEFLWRLARAYSDVYYIESDYEEKKNYASEGKLVAERAIELNDSSAESHRWFAIMCGYMSEYDNVQNKIKNGYLFKEHLDKAIELNPHDPLQYYLLGRWCYEVSRLSWIERKVAATLFGNPPTATVQDALNYFLKAEEMHPGYSKYNYVFLAKCYRDLGQKTKALKYCNDASAIASVTKEDKDAQKDLEVLIASISP